MVFSLNRSTWSNLHVMWIHTIHPNYVCCLKKSLYSLKQAPLAWFQRLSDFFISLGFSSSCADTSLFIFTRGTSLLYLLIYIDDIISIGNNFTFISCFISRLNSEFAIKDLSLLSYFLRLEVSYTNTGLFLSQSKYARDILTRSELLDS